MGDKTIINLIIRFIAGVLVAVGGIWMLRGVGILPGSFMTGQLKWAAYGALSVAVGVALMIQSRRSPPH